MNEKLVILEANLSTLFKEFLSLKEAIAAGFKKVDANFGSIGSRLSSLEKQIKELNFKIANLDTNTSSGLNEVGTKIESLTEEINKISVVTKYDEMYRNQQGISN